jgi:hypothetical protein
MTVQPQLLDPGGPAVIARALTLHHALEIVARLSCALALGSLIAYRPWRRLPGNRSAAPQPATAQAQTIIAVAGSFLVIVIGDSLARAFTALEPKIEEYRALIHDEVVVDDKKLYSNAAFESGIEDLKSFIEARRAYLLASPELN